MQQVVDPGRVIKSFIVSLILLCLVLFGLMQGYLYLADNQLPFLKTGFSDWLATEDITNIVFSGVGIPLLVAIAGLSAFIASRQGKYIFNTGAGTLTFPASAMSASNYSLSQLFKGQIFSNLLRMETIRLQDIDEITSADYFSVTRDTNTNHHNEGSDIRIGNIGFSTGNRRSTHTRVTYSYALDLIGRMGEVSLRFSSRGKRHQVAELFRQAGKEVTVLKEPLPER